jgi:hypothetical protein
MTENVAHKEEGNEGISLDDAGIIFFEEAAGDA